MPGARSWRRSSSGPMARTGWALRRDDDAAPPSSLQGCVSPARRCPGGRAPHGGAGRQQPQREELDAAEARSLLGERHLGRLAIPDFGGPVIFPVNYVFDQDLVIFRTDPGSKLDAATEREAVAFEVDAIEETTRTGWSVVVRGTLADI